MRDAFHLEMQEVNESLRLATPDKAEALARGNEMAEAVKSQMQSVLSN